jgi:AcrR family transcriptional regulator
VSPRATALSPDDRRKAILDAVVPLLVERGGDVTTKEIAQAAGIAEGTIFRVFPDKATLLFAAAEEAINPAGGQEAFEAAMAGCADLRERIVVAAERVLDRMRMTMAVMGAVRPYLAAQFHEAHTKKKQVPFGPPEFMLQAQRDLHDRLTGLFAPYADELAVTPETAALALRSLTFGAARPEWGMKPALTPDEIADIVLDGVRTRHDPGSHTGTHVGPHPREK